MKEGISAMGKLFIISLWFVISSASFVGATKEVVIRIMGTDVLANAVQETADVFREKNPEYVMIVTGGGASKGFLGLLKKHNEVVATIRNMSFEEKAACSHAGIRLVRYIIGWYGIAVVANSGNPITSLTTEQCKRIFSGKLSSWEQVGGPAIPIAPIIPSPTKYEISEAFQQLVLSGGQYPKVCAFKAHWMGVITEVARVRGAVGICAARRAYQSGKRIKILGIKETETASASLPSVQSAYGESYPLRRAISFFWDEKSPLSIHIKKFAAFCKTFGLPTYR